jgi:hypothetical protein
VRIRPIASAAVIGGIILIGCSNQQELAVVNERTGSPFLDKGSVSNPLRVQKPPGKVLTRRAGKTGRSSQ